MIPGSSISHYRILSRLGEGGMGQVWLAEDTLLERQVALKVIWPHLVADPEGLRRFQQEGRAVAALNHPSIAQIHEIGEADGVPFLAMEYVDGMRLSDHVEGRALPLEEVVAIGTQLADALEEAHSKGVTHRDIKPGNIMLTGRGQVKILDFGLAKMQRREKRTGGEAITAPGEVVGTLRYMSPEQALGREVDHRSDIFSLGAVLYEMATGKQAFPGASPASVYDAIVNRDPVPPLDVNRSLNPGLDRIIRKALEKDRDLRYQTASDLRADLKRLKRDVETRPPSRERRKVLLPAAVAAVILLLAVAGWMALKRRTRAEPPAPLEAIPLTSYPGSESQPSFSPDGNQVAFAWNASSEDNWDIYIKVVDAGTPLRLTSNPATDYSPAWSPDGRHIAFLRQSEENSGFYLIPALGGLERRLGPASPERVGVDSPYVAWSRDGKTLALADRESPGQPMAIFLLELDSGQRRRITSPPPKTYGDSAPAFSSDGRTLVFVRTGSLSVQDIYSVPLAGGEPRRLTSDGRRIYGLAWRHTDDTIFFSSARAGSSRLWKMSLSRPPEQVYGVGENASFLAIAPRGDRLAYTRGIIDQNIWRYELTGPGSRGEPPRSLITSTKNEQGPQYSPDGKRIVFASTRTGRWEIFLADQDGRNPIQLTALDGPAAGTPHWSPDGRQIAFDARPQGNPDIYVVAAEGGAHRRLTNDVSEEIVPSWSRDGKWIYFASNRTFSYEIWKVPAGGGPAVQVTRKGGFHGHESPDGKYFYYARSPSQPGLWRVSVKGGEEEPVIESFRAGFWGYWEVVKNGIYFLDRQEMEGNGVRYFLRFLDLATRRDRLVMPLERRPYNSGLALSPDGRYCLYTQVDRSDTDIMLVNNFR
ncbi:MAG: PD40 domain-containing protein [Bryobacterales bacterium]|nr:PD40 domain-containing protein [Bryobacterales bacterium]